jgi:hypothetical protein
VIRAWLFPLAVMTVTALAIGAFLHPSRGGPAGVAAIVLYSLALSAYLVLRVVREGHGPSRRQARRMPRGTD